MFAAGDDGGVAVNAHVHLIVPDEFGNQGLRREQGDVFVSLHDSSGKRRNAEIRCIEIFKIGGVAIDPRRRPFMLNLDEVLSGGAGGFRPCGGGEKQGTERDEEYCARCDANA